MSGIIDPRAEPTFEMPSVTEQALGAIHAQLQQLMNAVLNLNGQLDMGLRLACGQMSKHEVKVKFEDHDKKVRVAQALADKAGPED